MEISGPHLGFAILVGGLLFGAIYALVEQARLLYERGSTINCTTLVAIVGLVVVLFTAGLYALLQAFGYRR